MDQFQPNTRFSIFPPAIKYLLIANAIVFLATKSIFTGVWTPLGAVIARKFLMNRIDIAVRRGRLISMTTDSGKTLICMEESAAKTWRQHKVK